MTTNKYKPTEFEVEKDWNTAGSKDNEALLSEMGIPPRDYGSCSWSELPKSVRKAITEYVEDKEYIAPPRPGMSQNVLEPPWMQIDCENNGGVWAPGL
jgi:hypothetical protein